jgi:hypothetical protein
MKIKYTILLTILFFKTYAQETWSVLKISEVLKNDANAVIRLDDTELTIENIGKSILKKHWVVSIFNEQGEKDFATFRADYDKFSKIKKIEGSIYDKNGILLKKLKNSEIQDFGVGGDDVTDYRAKIAEFDKKFYPFPYTVEFSYELENTNMLFYPGWTPIENTKTSVEKSKFSLKTMPEIKYSKKELNLPSISIKSNDGKFWVETWEANSIVGIQEEEYSMYENLPQLLLAPQEFKVDGYLGRMTKWEELSSFYYHLNKGRDVLPESTIQKLKDKIGTEKDPYKKVKIVYEFMQSHTRYVSIQLGIGGWQSIPAKEVAEKGYGDCKALTNYTLALLKQVGITGYNCIIAAGEEKSFNFEDFVSSRFNHVLACVPIEKDTIWLECTSQTNPFGYQGNFTGNRKALIVKEKGGKLVSTSKYKPEDNQQKRFTLVTIEANGNAKVKVETKYTGIQQDTRAMVYESKNSKDQKDWLSQRISIPSFELTQIKPQIKKNRIPELTENLDINAIKLASISGQRMFVKLNVMTGFLSVPIKKENRQTQLFLNPNIHSFVDSDSTIFIVPEEYKVEFVPKEINEINEFGTFSVKTHVENNKIVYRRNIKVKANTYPKEYFDKWVDFIKLVNKSDNQKMVLVKKVT